MAFSSGFDLDVVVGVGGVESPRNWGWVLKGPDQGKKFHLTDAGFGVGLDVSGGVNATFFFYTGDPKNFTMQTLNGPRTEVNLSYSFFIDIGGGIAFSEQDIHGARVIAIKGIGGLGIPTKVGGNVNYGTTVISPSD